MQFRDNVAYDNADLGFGGTAGIGEAGKSGKNILSSLLGGVGSTLTAGLQSSAGGDLGKLAMTQVSVAKVWQVKVQSSSKTDWFNNESKHSCII